MGDTVAVGVHYGLMGIKCLAPKRTDPHSKATRFCKNPLPGPTYMALFETLLLFTRVHLSAWSLK